MNSLKEAKVMSDPLELSWKPGSQLASLVVGWGSDAGRLGETATGYLNKKLDGKKFFEIEPAEFFQLNGITIEDDLVQFPECNFYACPGNNLIILQSPPPNYAWYRFFNQVLDAAEHYGKVKEVYLLGGMLSLLPHSASRQMWGTFSSLEMKEDLGSYDLGSGLDYQTPPGQKPTLNSFFLWAARKRNIKGVSLWVPVPFYLMSVDDPKAQKKILEFLKQRLNLEIDLSDLDEAINKQDQRLAEARRSLPDIDDYLMKLESNQRLSEEENMKLVKEVEDYLKPKMDR
jgi:proteasome assembly chaperone (PAC2) family protein